MNGAQSKTSTQVPMPKKGAVAAVRPEGAGSGAATDHAGRRRAGDRDQRGPASQVAATSTRVIGPPSQITATAGASATAFAPLAHVTPIPVVPEVDRRLRSRSSRARYRALATCRYGAPFTGTR